MSIISSNHIDLKSISIWGLYKTSEWFLMDWKKSIFHDKDTRDLLIKYNYIEYIDEGVLIKKHQDIDICSKDSEKPVLISSLKTDHFILKEYTSVEELQLWLYKNIIESASERNLDPYDLRLGYYEYDPRDYIKIEQQFHILIL